MAINKVVNKSTKSHGAMRNVLEYVLRDEKVKQGYVEIVGPYPGETINYDEIYQSWLAEKKLWDKDSGRMYAHNIISFHKDEIITPEKVLEIGKQFSDKFFSGFQCLIGVHQDKEHLHCHIVTNSVSYIDGHKLHQNKRDLEKQKNYTNDLCKELNLSIAEKGHHFDGSLIEEGQLTAWSKDKFNLINDESKKSYVANCAIALLEVVPHSTNRNDFINGMEELGWSVNWSDSRKHIVFQNEEGKKVRDSNISNTFAMDISKEALIHEFERQNALRLAEQEYEDRRRQLSRYQKELDAAITRAGIDNKAVGNNTITTVTIGGDKGLISEEDTTSFIRELRSQERTSAEKRDDSISERKNRDIERERSRTETKRTTDKDEQRPQRESSPNRRKSIEDDLSL